MSNIMESVKSAKNLITLIGKVFANHSSELCLVAAAGTGVATVVTACKATVEVQPIIEEARQSISDINEHAEEDVEYAENKKVADLRAVKLGLVKNIGIKYLKTAGFAATTCVLVVASHNTQKNTIKELEKANTSLAAAWASTREAFSKYRENVVKDLGPEKDLEYRYNIEDVEEEVRTVTKSGKEKITKEHRKVLNDNLPPLVRCISEESCGLVTEAIYDDDEIKRIVGSGQYADYRGNQYLIMALKNIEDFIKKEIREKGGITVERIDSLLRMDIQLTRPEAEFNRNAGFICDPHHEFSFNMYDIKSQENRDFFNGYEHRIYIEIPINSTNVCRDLRTLSEEYSKKRRGLIA